MKLSPGLLRRHFTSFNRPWYHQRFDACPLFLLAVSEGELRREKRKRAWGHFTHHVCASEHDHGDWYIDQRDIEVISTGMLAAEMRRPGFVRTLMAQWRVDERRYEQRCREIWHTDLSHWSAAEVGAGMRELLELAARAYSSSSIIDGFALGTDELTQRELNVLLTKRGLSEVRHRYFTALTAPVTPSFINEEQIALLRLTASIKNRRLFSRGSSSTIWKNIRRAHPVLTKLIEAHTKRYFWIRNNYADGEPMTPPDFVREIRAIFTSGINPRHEAQAIVSTPKRNKAGKARVLATLKPGPKLTALIRVNESFTGWQDARKKRTFLFSATATMLLKRASQLTEYTLGELKYLVEPELSALLAGKRAPTRAECRRRRQSSLFYHRGNSIDVVSGPAASRFFKRFLAFQKSEQVEDFRGLPANRGVATGIARVIKSVQEMNRVKPGDILVAVMTRPDYISAMKRAAAIVTNEGGITSHAAIVSRELRIPCVIGTKIATEVIHDGDLVEVNGNHGVVKVLQRNS